MGAHTPSPKHPSTKPPNGLPTIKTIKLFYTLGQTFKTTTTSINNISETIERTHARIYTLHITLLLRLRTSQSSAE